jgi:hypothetical protein
MARNYRTAPSPLTPQEMGCITNALHADAVSCSDCTTIGDVTAFCSLHREVGHRLFWPNPDQPVWKN